MANRTIKDAKTIHGTNPQYLIEKIIRTRVYESRYWKEDCFALNAELLVDKGVELKYIGGIYGGNIKPTPFICLLLKLLQIQPEKDIIIEFIRQEDFKYIRALGAFYLRLTGTSLEVWKYLEPLYNDYRKMRKMDRMGKFSVLYMDEFIDTLLREDRVYDIILPRISKRELHEEANELEPRISPLEEDLENVESEEEAVEQHFIDRERERFTSPLKKRDQRRRSRSPVHKRDRDQGRERRRDRSRSKERRRRSRSNSLRKDEKSRKRSFKKEKSRSDQKDEKESLENEIKEANALRAKLGLKPLRP